MALGTLADLEQLVPSVDRPSALSLYSKAIDITRAIYSNYHVYPYLYMAHYCHRHQQYKEALINWAHAASVISRYYIVIGTIFSRFYIVTDIILLLAAFILSW